MKKILALVLALMMVLCAVSALAAGSKETPGGGGSTVEEEAPVITVKFITDSEASAAAIKAFKDAFDAGDVLAPLPDAIKAQIPDGFGVINEMVTAQFEGEVGKVTDDMIMNVMFETKYGEKEKVMVVIGILPEAADGEIEWNMFEGEGKADGSVDVTIPKAIFEKVQTNPFLIGVISEAK